MGGKWLALFTKTWVGLFGLLGVSVGAVVLSVAPNEPWLNPGGIPQLLEFLRAVLHPDLSLSFLGITCAATLQTLAFAICGTVLSLGLGFGLGVVASEVWWVAIAPSWSWWISRGIRSVLTVPRSLHEALWGVLCVELFGLDPLVAIVAITLTFGSIVAKVFSELMDAVPRQGFDALRHGGARPGAAFVFGILPVVWADLLSYGLYRFDCALRSAAVLGIIGAGGLGYQIRLSLQSLRYEQLWTLLGALFLLTAMGEVWATVLMGQKVRVQRRSRWLVGGVAIATALAFVWVGADYGQLFSPQPYVRLVNLLASAWPTDWSTLGASWGAAFVVLRDTVVMSVVAIVIAGFGGIIFAFLGSQRLGQETQKSENSTLPSNSRNSRNSLSALIKSFRLIGVRALLLVERGVPEPVWALLCLFILFPGILPGAIALGIHNMGILGRLMAEVIDNVDPRPIQALRNTGTHTLAVFLYGVLPQVLPRFLGYLLYRWEVCLRATIVVGLVGAGGLGRLIAEALSSFHYAGLASALIALFGLTLAADTLSQILRRSLQGNNPA